MIAARTVPPPTSCVDATEEQADPVDRYRADVETLNSAGVELTVQGGTLDDGYAMIVYRDDFGTQHSASYTVEGGENVVGGMLEAYDGETYEPLSDEDAEAEGEHFLKPSEHDHFVHRCSQRVAGEPVDLPMVNDRFRSEFIENLGDAEMDAVTDGAPREWQEAFGEPAIRPIVPWRQGRRITRERHEASLNPTRSLTYRGVVLDLDSFTGSDAEALRAVHEAARLTATQLGWRDAELNPPTR